MRRPRRRCGGGGRLAARFRPSPGPPARRAPRRSGGRRAAAARPTTPRSAPNRAPAGASRPGPDRGALDRPGTGGQQRVDPPGQPGLLGAGIEASYAALRRRTFLPPSGSTSTARNVSPGGACGASAGSSSSAAEKEAFVVPPSGGEYRLKPELRTTASASSTSITSSSPSIPTARAEGKVIRGLGWNPWLKPSARPARRNTRSRHRIRSRCPISRKSPCLEKRMRTRNRTISPTFPATAVAGGEPKTVYSVISRTYFLTSSLR